MVPGPGPPGRRPRPRRGPSLRLRRHMRSKLLRAEHRRGAARCTACGLLDVVGEGRPVVAGGVAPPHRRPARAGHRATTAIDARSSRIEGDPADVAGLDGRSAARGGHGRWPRRVIVADLDQGQHVQRPGLHRPVTRRRWSSRDSRYQCSRWDSGGGEEVVAAERPQDVALAGVVADLAIQRQRLLQLLRAREGRALLGQRELVVGQAHDRHDVRVGVVVERVGDLALVAELAPDPERLVVPAVGDRVVGLPVRDAAERLREPRPRYGSRLQPCAAIASNRVRASFR